MRLLLWGVIVLAAPLVAFHGKPPVPPEALEKGEGRRRAGADKIDVSGTIRELQAAQPEYIGIGNSMMFTRLGMTPEKITALTGRKFFFIYKNGSDTPIWYLTLKNVVVPSGVHPRAVLLFVRDNELTAPFTGKGADAPYLASLKGGQEPELDKFMRKAGPGSVEGLYSFSDWREAMSRHLTDMALDLGGGSVPKKAQKFALSARFGLEHLRGDLRSDLPQADELGLYSGSYADGAAASLLPEILKQVEKCGARLVVFRIKRRPDAVTNLPDEPEAMKGYADFLGAWLKERGALFFDETYDVSIHLTDYLDGDHIRPERMDWYRDYFWQRMKEVLP